MRSTFIALMLILPAVGLAIGCVGLVNLKRFAARKRQIDTPSDLEAFKRVAKTQMVLALMVIPFLAAPGILMGVGFFTGIFKFQDIFYVLIPSGLVVGFSQAVIKPVEGAVQQTPTPDETLRQERDRVVESWLHRPLPDW